MAALVVASAALTVGWHTLRAQQEINRSQLEINQVQMDRHDRRFAARVSWWRVPFDTENPQNSLVVEVIKLQNRSPVPLRNILFEVGTEGDPLIYPVDEDVPPCHILTFHILAPTSDGADFARGQHSLGDRDRIRLYFNDTQGVWVRDVTGVRRAEMPSQLDENPMTIDRVEGTDREVEDCGEGG